MPYVNVKLSSKIDAHKKQNIANGIIDFLVDILKKERSLSSLLIQETESDWYIGSDLQNKQIQVFVEINITDNTNTEFEKSEMIKSTFDLLEKELGSLPLATYIIIKEHKATDWGYSGITPKQRKISNNTFQGRYDGMGNNGAKRALLVIDVQNEYFTGKLPVCYPENSLPNVLKSIEAAKEHDIPVIMVQHTLLSPEAKAFIKGTDGWELLDEMKSVNYDYYIEKNFPSAFVGTDLETWLRQNGIDTIVISGYMTQFCCDTTARYAYHLGFNVEFLSDATATLSFENNAGKVNAEELHRAILVVQAARFSRVMSTQEWIQSIDA
ncbi:isochorismatase family protein [Sulfuricurvum sp.]|uniref:isochorismatase family protein n=1 Tax=Sulfuricurvum sp. TaxID=2025608 RepID=UPI0026393F70|nr:isochorismatase family protein [Sulfuricurvum sp.]MDD4950262.1 isochorismatase family protein [Sulfuricurvum sp.]MDD5052579.1 isochorismatase family protein [Sulfuricurvum sp.]